MKRRATKRSKWQWLGFGIGAVVPIAIALAVAYQLQLERALATIYLFAGYILVAVCLLAIIGAVFISRFRSAFIGIAMGVLATWTIPVLADALRNSAPQPGHSTLKVITFNWLHSDRNYDDVYQWVRRENPDLLVINEFSDQIAGVTDTLYPQFPFRSKAAGDVIVLSRYPIEHERKFILAGHNLVRVDVRVGSQSLQAYGVHAPTLRTTPELMDRNDYLVMTSKVLENDALSPTIVMGDFNATRWDPHFSRIIARAKMHEEPRLFPLASRMGVRSKLPFIGSPIDHIIGSQGVRLSGCHTGPFLGSDHLPVVCQVQF